MSYYNSTNNINIVMLSYSRYFTYNFFNFDWAPKFQLFRKIKAAKKAVLLSLVGTDKSEGGAGRVVVARQARHITRLLYIFFENIISARGTFNSRVAQILCARAGTLKCRCARIHRDFILTVRINRVKMYVYSWGTFYSKKFKKTKVSLGLYK